VSARPFNFLILGLGVCAVSAAAVLIREADAPALIIAAYRLSIASAVLLAFAAGREGWSKSKRRIGQAAVSVTQAAGLNGATETQAARTPARFRPSRTTALTVLAGVFLALHFAFWIASVKETSIVTSVVLTTAQPLLVAVAAGPLLGERPSASVWLGIGLAIAGSALMIGDDAGSSDTLRGDAFALLGAALAGAYFLVGRSLRVGGAGWREYVTGAYSTAAVVLIALAAASGASFTGYSTETYAYMLLLALVPQLIGHTALNRSLGYLPVVAVTVAVLGEPVGATVLAMAVLGETPTPLELAGGLLVLAGVYAGLRSSFRTAAPAVTA
jgi:drug/metabolite transporter (DMT)-like permease